MLPTQKGEVEKVLLGHTSNPLPPRYSLELGLQGDPLHGSVALDPRAMAQGHTQVLSQRFQNKHGGWAWPGLVTPGLSAWRNIIIIPAACRPQPGCPL